MHGYCANLAFNILNIHKSFESFIVSRWPQDCTWGLARCTRTSVWCVAVYVCIYLCMCTYACAYMQCVCGVYLSAYMWYGYVNLHCVYVFGVHCGEMRKEEWIDNTETGRKVERTRRWRGGTASLGWTTVPLRGATQAWCVRAMSFASLVTAQHMLWISFLTKSSRHFLADCPSVLASTEQKELLGGDSASWMDWAKLVLTMSLKL